MRTSVKQRCLSLLLMRVVRSVHTINVDRWHAEMSFGTPVRQRCQSLLLMCFSFDLYIPAMSIASTQRWHVVHMRSSDANRFHSCVFRSMCTYQRCRSLACRDVMWGTCEAAMPIAFTHVCSQGLYMPAMSTASMHGCHSGHL